MKIRKTLIFVVIMLSCLCACAHSAIPSAYDIKLKTPVKTLIYEVGQSEQSIEVTIDSRRYRELSSEQGFYLSYHILNTEKEEVLHDGLRTDIGIIDARGVKKINMLFEVPEISGSYILEIDMVEEQVTWFSEQGMPTLQIPLEVVSPPHTN